MVWFLRGLRRSVVTTRYPQRVDEWAAGLPTPPSFDPDLLTEELADRLVGVCPSGALRRDDGDLLVDLGSCTCCGRCAEESGGAARPSGAFELATWSRPALVKRVPIEGGPR
jgi:hypothetical protein